MYKRALTLSAVRVIDFAAFLDRNGSSRALSCYAAAPFMGARERRCERCATRSEEHTSELQSLMRISYAVFCLKTTTDYNRIIIITYSDSIYVSIDQTDYNTTDSNSF